MDEPQAATPESDPEIARLLRLAGHRPQPNADQLSRARASVHREWQSVVRRRKVVRVSRWALAPAVAAAAVIITMVSLRPDDGLTPADGAVVATMVRDLGVVQVVRAGESARALRRGETLVVGDVVETSPGSRAALTLARGASLRLDVDSRIVMTSDVVLQLTRGAIYIDSGTSVTPLQVETSLGRVRDIGTQFEVRVDDAALAVRVREGAIVVRGDGDPVMARAGEGVRVMPGRPVERSAVSPTGAEWGWASLIAPSFVLEGSSLPQFLDWVAREEGLTWRFRDDATAQRGRHVVTHGTVDGLAPLEAVDVVLPTCGMRAVRDGDVLTVSFLEAAP